MPTLSVLICTYQRDRLLARCLAALTEQTTQRPDQIVIVTASQEQEGTVLDRCLTVAGIRLIFLKTHHVNLATSRNAGLPHCTGDIVAMTDDDAEVSPDWVTQIKRVHLEQPEAGAVGGPVYGADHQSRLSRIADQVTFPVLPSARAVRTLPGVNVAYKRAALDRVGPQDECLFRGEDTDFNWRVQQLGFSVYFDPAIRVHHWHRSSARGFWQQHYMYGRAYYRVRRKWPDMYCVYPHGLRRPKDLLKAVYFFAAVFIEPLVAIRRLSRLTDRLLAYPLLLVNQLVWRFGMIREKFGAAC